MDCELIFIKRRGLFAKDPLLTGMDLVDWV